jgi:DNA-binding CsgD family transcriptional regulator
LSQTGVALVAQGRVEEGVRCLDEAMAVSLGTAGSPDTVVFTSCMVMTSCAECAEFAHAVHWVRATIAFTEQYGCPFLYAECRILYGAVLLATGEWRQAEDELVAGLELARGAVPALHRLAVATIAELWVGQGRVEEAERLVAGHDDHAEMAPVLARIHLQRGRPATARRRLEAIGERRLEGGVLLELLGDAELATGDAQAASRRGRDLAALGSSVGCELLVARGDRLFGRPAAALGDPASARRHLDAALVAFGRLEMRYEAARTRALLAEALWEAEPEVATAEARAALAAFEVLGAGADADLVASLLRRLGVTAARLGPRGQVGLTKREQQVLGLLGEGLSNPEIAARLHLSRETVEHHVAHVLSKLGVRSRAEAAAEAVRRLGTGSAKEIGDFADARIGLSMRPSAARPSLARSAPGLRPDQRDHRLAHHPCRARHRRGLAWIGLLDRIGGRHDEVIVRFSIEVARTEAWRFAVELAALARDDWAGPIGPRDARVAHLARRVLKPGWLSAGLLVIRARESNDVRRNIETLSRVTGPDLRLVEARVRQERAPTQ